MSADSLIPGNDQYSYDFTSGETKVYEGINGHTELAPGIWGMMAGNGLPDNTIDFADHTDCWIPEAGQRGYLQGDYNFDTTTDNKDKNDYWHPNRGKGCQVPE